MFDPSHIVFNSRKLMLIRYESYDRPSRVKTPWRESLDIRRYAVVLNPGTSRNRTIYRGSLASP